MTFLRWLIALLLVGYVGGLAALFFLQRKLIFPIPQTARTAPEAAGFPEAEEHVLTTADGERVIIWYVVAKVGHAVVIYFPGNGDVLAGCVSRFRDITADGTGLVALSYRGYAGSSGRPSERGLLQDATAACAFTSARYGADQIVLWGFSLGSGVAVALAADQPVGKLVLEAPYTSIAELAAGRFAMVPVSWLLRDRFHTDQRIGRVTAPLLIMHGARDAVIPISFGERLFARAHQPKQFVRFAEGGHNNLDNYGAIETVRQFIGASKG
jgi:fermentation-respiration switch protein FrsA (DUF1100 family)